MNVNYLDYRQTKCFSTTIIRYLDHDPQLRPFISHFPTLEGFSELLKTKRLVETNRELLVEVLKKQYADLDLTNLTNTKVLSNIDSLLHPNTFTVTTGHQLNLFTGPLYLIFKLVTTINLAEALATQFPDKKFVPLYWMATEDHDFEEINHTFIRREKIVWEHPAHGAVGPLQLNDIERVLQAYASLLGSSEHAQKLVKLVEQAYTQHSTLAEATRYLVHTLLGGYGLVILDANQPELKRTFSPIVLQDIVQQNSFKCINRSSHQLENVGIDIQGHTREINFFYLKDQLRERLVLKNGLYQVLHSNLVFDQEQLQQEVQNHPERFSPNVMMRPLYQEHILPNIAYIGGGSEIAYWLQLKSNFEYYQLDFPILVLRNSALIINQKQNAQLKKLGLRIIDLFDSIQTLQKKWVFSHTQHPLTLNQEWQELSIIFEKIKTQASPIDVSLVSSTEAIKARLHQALLRLEKKLLKAEKRNHREALSRIDRLKNELFPQGILQERTENFGSFYARQGESFIQSLVESFRPLDFQFTVLNEN